MAKREKEKSRTHILVGTFLLKLTSIASMAIIVVVRPKVKEMISFVETGYVALAGERTYWKGSLAHDFVESGMMLDFGRLLVI